MLTLQRFRLGYAPLPVLTKKPIPPDSFNMGEHDAAFIANLSKNEKNFGVPGKVVQIVRPFYLGKTEVTYDQYDYYVWQQHRSGNTKITFPITVKGGRGNYPVANVSWFEAAEYAKWLGDQTKNTCRLPTEAEWEYAARAGTITAYSWGDKLGIGNANCDGCGNSQSNLKEECQKKDLTAMPVACFSPNNFDLYDISGNVWEWTCSNWEDQFDGSEQQCNNDTTKRTQVRVLRGGSWFDNQDRARVSARSGVLTSDASGDDVGFRVLCESPIE
ncbi:MAG: SUMF1/EgtB/PvdO family nonheme iron enzyme [Proteobacteria bacterium]|nr:SUMF1/EgtB/PvdO family nonheme iron enzyme [Pseudomonadota bacterium]